LFVVQLDVHTLKIPEKGKGVWIGRTGFGDNPHGNDFFWDAPLVRLLDALTVITGEPKYRRAASEYTTCVFERCWMNHGGRKYLAAGDHSCYLLTTDKVNKGCHEMRSVRLPWRRMHELNPELTSHEIEGLYNHIVDPRTFAFNRHVPTGGKPLSLPSSGGTYIAAWAFLHSKTGEEKYLDWARKLADLYWNWRGEETGIPVTWGEGRGNRTGGCEPFRGLCALLLYAAEYLGKEKGQPFREQAVAYCRAYRKYGLGEKGFCAEFNTETGEGYDEHSLHEHVWKDGRLLQVAATVSYCAMKTKDEDALVVAKRMADSLAHPEAPGYLAGLKAGDRALGPRRTGSPAYRIALPIQTFLYLYLATGDIKYLEKARPWVETAWKRYYRKGFFVGGADADLYYNRAGSAYLALSLLRYELLRYGLQDFIEDDVVMQN
jgi:hypothetical protein